MSKSKSSTPVNTLVFTSLVNVVTQFGFDGLSTSH